VVGLSRREFLRRYAPRELTSNAIAAAGASDFAAFTRGTGIRDIAQVAFCGSVNNLLSSRPLGGSGRLIAEISENWLV
jgi:hypothetical protein